MELSELQDIRLRKAETLREHGRNPYALRSGRTHTTTEAHHRFAELEASAGEGAEDAEQITVAGRVVSFRDMGKTLFAHVRDGSGELQLYVRLNDVGDEAHHEFSTLVDLGDFVQATGTLFRTRTGEVSLRVQTFSIQTKALNAPPEKRKGLRDREIRYRQRYADLIANADVREVFRFRSALVHAIRTFLHDEDFMEVETPVLQPLYGGAAARPFVTHYNALGHDFYLRIADELYLKRLIVGGYERVFEISKDFRNEGMDKTHSPEFTMLEWYEAYGDYLTVLERTERLFAYIAGHVIGSTTFTSGGHTIDLAGPWPRVTMRELIRQHTGIDYMKFPEAEDLLRAARSTGAEIESGTVWPRIVDELYKHAVRPNIIQPTVMMDHPLALSPLAKRKEDDPDHVERFQLIIAGTELANAFTELNDPMDQLARFIEQQKDREAGDLDAMPIDEDYVNALMYGMPPTGGIGIGIDRLTMTLTDQANIRDVILFPAMRPIGSQVPDADLDEEFEDDEDE
ncbi:MAG: lysine--tRNA ligase [Chloroflexota bacterium]|nr:lysine--tRNA ligase [Chloroflexota bacterium]